MAERVFTAAAVNVALELAGVRTRTEGPIPTSGIAGMWKRGGWSLPNYIAALALGVLPDGWERHHASDSIFVLYSKEYDQWVITADANQGLLHCPHWYWPEAVRSGQADIACRLLAAHVELERRRAEKGGEP